MEKRIKCCLCGKWIEDLGNNPYPLAEEGRCCDECNFEKVVPARLENTKFKKLYKPYMEIGGKR